MLSIILPTTQPAKIHTTQTTKFQPCCPCCTYLISNTTKIFNCATNSFDPSCIVTSTKVAKDTNGSVESHNITSVLNLIIPTSSNQMNKGLIMADGEWSIFSNSSLDTKNSLFKYLNNVSEEVLFVPKHLQHETVKDSDSFANKSASSPVNDSAIVLKTNSDTHKSQNTSLDSINLFMNENKSTMKTDLAKELILNHSGISDSQLIEDKTRLVTNHSDLYQSIGNETNQLRTTKKHTVVSRSRDQPVNHTASSNFSGSVSIIETGVSGGNKHVNWSSGLTTFNKTDIFHVGKKCYSLCNFTAIENKTGITGVPKKEEKQFEIQKIKIKGKQKSDYEANRGLRMKRCKPKAVNTRQIDMMVNPLEDSDVAGAGINCAILVRRHLVSTHSTKNETKAQPENTPNSKKTPNKNNVGTGTSYEERQKELEQIKYKILNDIYDQPTSEGKADDQNSLNKSIPIDHTMMQQVTEEETIDEALKDANLGIVGLDDHPAIDPADNATYKNSTKNSSKSKSLIKGDRKHQKVITVEKETNKLGENITEFKKKRLKRILCFGDSLTRGYYKQGLAYHPYSIRLKQLLEQYSVNTTIYELINSGVNSECAATDMQTRLPKMLKNYAPLDIVVILGGTNDILGHCGNISNLFKSIQTLHEIVLAHGLKSVVMTVPPIFKINGKIITDEVKKLLAELNEKLRIYVDIHMHPDRIFLIDLADKLSHQDDPLSKSIWDDEVHLSPQGYDQAGEIIFNGIKGKF